MVYLSQIEATHVTEFISASGINDSLRLENFYLHDIKAQTLKAGKISFCKNFNMTEVTLNTADRHPIISENNSYSNIHPTIN